MNLEDFALLRTCALQPVNCMAHLCSHHDHPGHCFTNSLLSISFLRLSYCQLYTVAYRMTVCHNHFPHFICAQHQCCQQ